jgi:diaminopimelate epimerase
MSLDFTKLHGLGNDFAVFDLRENPQLSEGLSGQKAVDLCDRRRGIGADGLLLLTEPRRSSHLVHMRIINADGSEPEMCGNGIRCAARFLALSGIRGEMAIETEAGLRICTPVGDHPAAQYRVDMGEPSFAPKEIGLQQSEPLVAGPIVVEGRSFESTAVSMGNPHLVIFEGPNAELASRYGAAIEHHELFAARTNVEWVEQKAPQRLDVVVWERGCGLTQACGTGACATAVAAVRTKRCSVNEPIVVGLPGGDLMIDVKADLSRVWMTGPAIEVYRGSL